MNAPIFDIAVRRIEGQPTSLADFKGQVMLVVNVASACGLTPQYEGLEKTYESYKDRGFVVLGFPANEFGAQEPGTNDEIAEFCATKYGVKFPMFEKIVVKGEGQHPLYRHLTTAVPGATEKPGGTLRERLAKAGRLEGRKDNDILWNFEKFLVARDGAVVARFSPEVAPDDLRLLAAIEAELARVA